MTPAKPKKPASFSGSVKKHIRAYFAAHDGELPPCGLYDRIICEVERILIAETLKLTKKNQIKTAKLLGINRNTLTKKIKQHGLLPAEKPKRPKAKKRL